MMRTQLRALLLTAGLGIAAGGLVFGEGAAEELLEEGSFTVEAPVAEARETLFSGLSSLDPEVRRAAVRMIQYAAEEAAPGAPDTGVPDTDQAPGVYEAVQDLFRDFRSTIRAPGQLLWQYDAVDTLYALDPDRTLAFLVEHNDQVLGSFDLYTLFSIIGFDKVPRFDNLFWYIDQQGPSATATAMFSVAMAEMHLSGGGSPYNRVLTQTYYGGRDHALYLDLLDYRIERGLPIEPFYHALARAGGVDPSRPVEQQSFTLDELLYQALLYRYGFTDDVYRKTFAFPESFVTYTDEAAAKYGLETPVGEVRRDFAEYAAFPSLRAADSLAHVYAGAPRPSDVERILSFTDSAEPAVLLEYVHFVGDAPASAERTRLLRAFAESPNAWARRESLSAFRDGNKTSRGPGSLEREPAFELTELYGLLDTEPDPRNKAIVLELLDARYHDREILESYLYSRHGVVSMTAAGLILKQHGGAL